MYPYIEGVGRMFDIQLDKNSNTPLYMQVYDYFKNLIENNNIGNTKLPSIRSLAKKLKVNNVTIVNAYRLLEQEGYVYSIKGSGTYVKIMPDPEYLPYLEEGDVELMVSGILPLSKDNINFASISPTPLLFPIEEFKKSLVEVLDRDGAHAFLYPEVSGYEPLRESISKFLFMNYDIKIDKNQILITSGGQQALDIVAKALINTGDTIFVENPTYSGAIASFNSRGARVRGIPILNDGIDLDLLDHYVKREKPKFLYIMTNYQSPTTYSYSKAKKKELLKMASKYDFYIIEDDFLTDLNYDNEKRYPLKSMDTENRVIFIKSFSKIFMPGIRIGFLTLSKNLYGDIIKAKHTTDISSSGFLQRAFDHYLRTGYWKNYIERVRSDYARKYRLMVSELEKFKKFFISYVPPNGGISIWLNLPAGIDALDLYEECQKNNLSIVPGIVFFIDETINMNYIRLSFGAIHDDEIVKGMKTLYEIISKMFVNLQSDYMPFI